MLLIGGGGREHAMALSIMKDGPELYLISHNKNPGLRRISRKMLIANIDDSNAVLDYAMRIRPEIIFIGPEDPLASGVTDILIAHGFSVFAPTSKAAKLETSKTFLRTLMNEKGIKGNISSFSFTEYKKASDFIDGLDYDFVIKPDGLTGGKGVMVQGLHFRSKEEGKGIIKRYFEEGINKILIEKKEEGEEFSLQAFVNGKEIYFLPVVQDYKRAMENDLGPNTGGMGSISFSERGLPFIPESHVSEAKSILKEIVISMSDDNIDYIGPIYGQFMATRSGPKVIEINARLGDPEAINVLSLMNDSLFSVGLSILNGANVTPEFRDSVNILRYVVPLGYGENPKPSRLSVDEKGIVMKGLKLVYASVNASGKAIVQTRSRSLGLLAEGRSIDEAVRKFDQIEHLIQGSFFMRHDIGTPQLIERKMKYMEGLQKR